MILRSEAIVLRVRPFRDSSLICQFYTQAFGRKDMLAKGVRSKRGRQKHALFQVGSQLQVVFYDRSTRELQSLSESSLAHTYACLYTEPARMMYAQLGCEVFAQAVQEEEANPDAYHLLKEYLLALDAPEARLYSVLIAFLVGMCAERGFGLTCPEASDHLPLLFDPETGQIQPTPGAADPVAHALHGFLTQAIPDPLPGPLKRQLLNSLLRYLARHQEGFNLPKSLQVFEAVFAR